MNNNRYKLIKKFYFPDGDWAEPQEIEITENGYARQVKTNNGVQLIYDKFITFNTEFFERVEGNVGKWCEYCGTSYGELDYNENQKCYVHKNCTEANEERVSKMSPEIKKLIGLRVESQPAKPEKDNFFCQEDTKREDINYDTKIGDFLKAKGYPSLADMMSPTKEKLSEDTKPEEDDDEDVMVNNNGSVVCKDCGRKMNLSLDAMKKLGEWMKDSYLMKEIEKERNTKPERIEEIKEEDCWISNEYEAFSFELARKLIRAVNYLLDRTDEK